MLKLDANKTLFFVLILSILILGSAFYIQYVLGYEACNLCIFQRIPYFLAIILVFFNFFIKDIGKYIFVLLLIIFSFSSNFIFLSFWY